MMRGTQNTNVGT